MSGNGQSGNPALSPTVRVKTVTLDSVVRQHDPKPKEDVIYRYSNGREFKQRTNANPYED